MIPTECILLLYLPNFEKFELNYQGPPAYVCIYIYTLWFINLLILDVIY